MNTFLRRTLSTVLLLTLFFIAIFWKGTVGTSVFALLTILLSYFAVREFTLILNSADQPANPVTPSLFTAVTAIFAILGLYSFCFLTALVFMVHCWTLFLTSNNEERAMRSILNSAAAYFLFTIPIVILVKIYSTSSILFLYLVLITKISDIGAYVTGTVSNALTHGGNHKLIPNISPGKSYEGAVGGLICAVAASCVIWPYCNMKMPFWVAIAAGVVLFFGSMAGDLSESAFKRTCRVKDSGNVIPGIGGVFDLVDSLLINAALFYLFLVFMR